MGALGGPVLEVTVPLVGLVRMILHSGVWKVSSYPSFFEQTVLNFLCSIVILKISIVETEFLRAERRRGVMQVLGKCPCESLSLFMFEI